MEPVQIGARLELLVDEFLLAGMSGGARLRLHSPVRREIVFETDAPWEGNACGYASLVRTDSGGYRIYYHGLHYRHSGPPAQGVEEHPAVLCVIESDDALNWRRPTVGLHEWGGSRHNNIVLPPEVVTSVDGDPAHTAVLRDENPDCPADERYKIVMLGNKPFGLYLLGSADGLDFRLLSEEPIITQGAFDSQNLLFWDSVRGEYREYHRGFNEGMRDIMTAVSPDCRAFPKPEWLEYTGAPAEQLYTNQIMPYPRAPHIFMGFPARYLERAWDLPLYQAPGLEERLCRARSHERYGSTVTDLLFMSSRDGLSFKRWPEALVRPGPQERHSWVYGDNYGVWGLLETPSDTENAPPELALYLSDGYWEGASVALRRYTIRQDGFVSLNAPLSGGEVVTHPLVFEGGTLTLNFESSGAGGVQVEIQDEAGVPLPGYSLADCPEIFGDRVRHQVLWRGGGDVRPLCGKPVRLRFVLRDADLYAFQFVPYEPDPASPDLTGITLPGQ